VVDNLFAGTGGDHLENTRDNDRMDFKGFAQAYRYLRFFMKYAGTISGTKGYLVIDEFRALLIDPEIDPLFEATVAATAMP